MNHFTENSGYKIKFTADITGQSNSLVFISLQLKLVKEYLLGKESYSSLARKHGLNEQSAKGQIKKWINANKQFGEEGLMRKRKNEIYSVQFKLDAVELYLTSEMSIREVANQLGMNNPPLISAWLKVYRTEAIEGLVDPK